MFTVQSLAIPDVKLLTPSVRSDHRGDFAEVYHARELAQAGIRERFVVDNHVRNGAANVVRGLHYQRAPAAQSKLVRVTRGRILDVAVDIRAGSPTLGRHVGVVLCAQKQQLLYVPEGFAHGFSVLEDDSEVHYKVNRYAQPDKALGIRWDDPALGIDWMLTGPAILAQRDQEHPGFAAYCAQAQTTRRRRAV